MPANKHKKVKLKKGAPTKWSPERQDAILSDIRGGLGEEESAWRNGIHPDTLRQWKKHNPAFYEGLLKAHSQFEQDNLTVIREASVNRYDNEGRLTRRGSWQASAWLLERRMHQKYGMRWAGELTGQGGKPLIPEKSDSELASFSTEELKTLLKAVTIASPMDTAIPSGANGDQSNGHPNGNGG
jgi:hypothetical protein